MKLDAVKNALAILVKQLTSKYDYYALYPAKIVAQNDDGTLELQPENEVWPGMSSVPVRFGVPGFEVRIKAGARVLFTFEDGDSRRPVVTSWDRAGVERVVIDAEVVDLRNGKGRAIAANGDAVLIPSTKPIPVLLFADELGTVPALYASPSGPVALTPTPKSMYLRFANPGFAAVGQIVAVSPNRTLGVPAAVGVHRARLSAWLAVGGRRLESCWAGVVRAAVRALRTEGTCEVFATEAFERADGPHLLTHACVGWRRSPVAAQVDDGGRTARLRAWVQLVVLRFSTPGSGGLLGEGDRGVSATQGGAARASLGGAAPASTR